VTAATDKWTKPEDLTEEQEALSIVAQWKYIEVPDVGDGKAVNLKTGTLAPITGTVLKLQEIQVGDVSEVREGDTRDKDVVVHYRNGTPECP
jgi:hypothetical protein